jgi:uncharacterized protein YcnI
MTLAPIFTRLCIALNSAYASTNASSPLSSTKDAAMDTLGTVPTHLEVGAATRVRGEMNDGVVTEQRRLQSR